MRIYLSGSIAVHFIDLPCPSLVRRGNVLPLPFGPEPFGNELPSGLSLRVEDKAELLTADGPRGSQRGSW